MGIYHRQAREAGFLFKWSDPACSFSLQKVQIACRGMIHEDLPLYAGVLELPGSSGSLADCRRDFISLLEELSACIPTRRDNEEQAQKLESLLVDALQIWILLMQSGFRPLFASNGASNLLAARRLNELLVSQLWHAQETANRPDGSICAKLFVLVCASLRTVPQRRHS